MGVKDEKEIRVKRTTQARLHKQGTSIRTSSRGIGGEYDSQWNSTHKAPKMINGILDEDSYEVGN